MIDHFRGKYSFLSNFYECNICYRGRTYKNAEAVFQSMKTIDENIRDMFITMTAKKAKKYGRVVELRKDWDTIKINVMYEVVYLKFAQNEHLKDLLLRTGSQELIETNSWNDTYWGVCNGIGQNNLGNILMWVRDDLREFEE